MIKNLKKHLSFSGEAIKAICEPLQSHFGITSLVYKRLQVDGSELVLATNPDWLDHYFKHELYKQNVLEKEPENYVRGELLWSQIQTHTPILNAAYEHNIAHGMTLIRPQKNHECEFFYLGSGRENYRLAQLLMNNVDLLDQFTDYFKLKAKPILTDAACHKIVIPNKYQLNQRSVDDIPCYQNEAMRHSFLNDLYSKGIVVGVDDAIVELTKRELSIAKELLQGKTMQEIGDALFISPRTVEVHIDHLKTKFQAKKKSILIQMLKKYLPVLS